MILGADIQHFPYTGNAFKVAAEWFTSFDCVLRFFVIRIFPLPLCIRTGIKPQKRHLAWLNFFTVHLLTYSYNILSRFAN